MRISFFGAAGTVTGSRFLVEHEGTRVLVDAGLFQGGVDLRARNRDELPFDVAALDAVVLTHAHLDHSGALPLLFRRGYRGPVHASVATRDLCEILLLDAAHLQEEDAKRARRADEDAAPPLFSVADAEAVLSRFAPWAFRAEHRIGSLRFHLTPAGHILGAACVHVTFGDRTVVFSGDVGRPNDPVMRPPEPIERADYLVIESTYGGRTHPRADLSEHLGDVARRTLDHEGVLVIPAFSVGRAQALMLLLAELRAARAIPGVPVFLDSPMATDTTHIYCSHLLEHRLPPKRCRAMCTAVRYVRDARESRAIASMAEPHVVIAGSGMATGGRVVHHLERRLPDPRSTVLLAGYQAPGTRGAELLAGAEEVSIFGDRVRVRAQIANIGGLSAHADEPELLSWLGSIAEPPRRTFVVHGEPEASAAIVRALGARGWVAEAPAMHQSIDLGDGL